MRPSCGEKQISPSGPRYAPPFSLPLIANAGADEVESFLPNRENLQRTFTYHREVKSQVCAREQTGRVVKVRVTASVENCR